jgi:hypothetical protein
MTVPRHNLNSPLPIAVDGWSEDLARDLRLFEPTSLELAGSWPDLSQFHGCVDSVSRLKLSGHPKNGQVDSLHGLSAFRNLRHLCLAGKVVAASGDAPPARLEGIDCVWQKQTQHLLESPSLKVVHLRAYPGPSLLDLRLGSSVEELSLLSPRIKCLQLPATDTALSTLSLVRARDLITLAGCESVLSLAVLHIAEAQNLGDIRALASLQALRELKLLDVPTSLDLNPIAEVQSLVRVHVAGKKAPPLPWRKILSLPKLQRADGKWDPDQITEEVMRAAPGPHVRIARFESFGARGARPLCIELERLPAVQTDA